MDAFRNRPAVRFCVPFMAGIVFGWYTDLPGQFLLFVTAFLLVGWRISFLLRFTTVSVVAAQLLIIVFGDVMIGYHARYVPDDDVNRCICPGRVVQIE